MKMEGRYLVFTAAVALTGITALATPWIASWRPGLAGVGADTIVVRSAEDDGPGSLREALLNSARAEKRMRIIVRPRRIVLRSPLPPLVHPEGVIIDGMESRCEIDARALTAGSVLDINSPNTVVTGIGITGAGGQAVLVRASRVQLRSMHIRNSGHGLFVVPEANDLLVEDVQFTANKTGIEMTSADTRATVRHCKFAKHQKAAIWTVSPTPPPDSAPVSLLVRDNTFDGDHTGIIAINIRTRVEGNDVRGARDTGIHISGKGSAVIRNRVRGGALHGIVLEHAQGTTVSGNEVDHNGGAGVMIRAGSDAIVTQNKLYENGYGVATVYGDAQRPARLTENLVMSNRYDGFYLVGGSTVVERNRALKNGQAAVRVLDVVSGTTRTAATPRLDANVFEANLVNAAVRDQYSIKSETGAIHVQ